MKHHYLCSSLGIRGMGKLPQQQRQLFRLLQQQRQQDLRCFSRESSCTTHAKPLSHSLHFLPSSFRPGQQQHSQQQRQRQRQDYTGRSFCSTRELSMRTSIASMATSKRRLASYSCSKTTTIMMTRLRALSSAAYESEAVETNQNHADDTTTPSSFHGGVRIFYASQMGTAQMFAVQLHEALLEEETTVLYPHKTLEDEKQQHPIITVQSLSEAGADLMSLSSSISSSLVNSRILHVFVVSTAGVGEMPDNGKPFMEWLQQQQDLQQLQHVRYVLFALGNSRAHPHHYCAAGVALDEALQKLGARPMFSMVKGDDGAGGSMEEEFDAFQDQVLQLVTASSSSSSAPEQEPDLDGQSRHDDASDGKDPLLTGTQQPGLSNSHVPPRYAPLRLRLSETTTTPATSTATVAFSHYPQRVRRHLLQHHDQNEKKLYASDADWLPVLDNRSLLRHGHDVATHTDGLHEMRLRLPKHLRGKYQTGDHLMIYSCNPNPLVEAYLQRIFIPTPESIEEDNVADVPERLDPHAVIEGTVPDEMAPTSSSSSSSYPHPTGLTVYETLRHCVDLNAPPSLQTARWLVGRKGDDLHYAEDILKPRRTVLDLLADPTLAHQDGQHHPPRKISLQDMLHALPPMQPRYYSIASSSKVHPDEIILTYRPVQYLNAQGHWRYGTCTRYMEALPGTRARDGDGNDQDHDETMSAGLVAAIRSNPSFRLPTDRSIPILLIAGGCGIAPIRAFLEELVDEEAQTRDDDRVSRRRVSLFLGFRNPSDAVYGEWVAQADDCGLLTLFRQTYTQGGAGADSALVSEALLQEAKHVYPLLMGQQHSNDVTATSSSSSSSSVGNGQVYICGGARLFGRAIEDALRRILEVEGNMSPEQAEDCFRNLVTQGRILEDLSD